MILMTPLQSEPPKKFSEYDKMLVFGVDNIETSEIFGKEDLTKAWEEMFPQYQMRKGDSSYFFSSHSKSLKFQLNMVTG